METKNNAVKFSQSIYLIDISENWFPSEEDFIKADEDIKNYNLDYDFGNINELYLEEYDKLDWEWM